MENIFKNKLSNYEETPPDFILKNLKNEIRGTNSSFIARNKYYIVASIVAVAVISSFVLFNNKSNEKQQIINNIDNVAIVKKEQTKTIDTNPVIEEKTTERKTKKEAVSTKKEIINTPKEKAQDIIINKNIDAGLDVVVCGNTIKMAPINTENGVWITNADIIIKDKNNPNTVITSKVEGETYLIWKEKIADNYITDTVKITFVNLPKSDIEIEQYLYNKKS